jgi:hypothetical protein
MDRGEVMRRTKQVADKLHTILFGASDKLTDFYRATGRGAFENASAFIVDVQVPDSLIVNRPEIWELSDERLEVLGKLYLSLDQFDRNTLVDLARYDERYGRTQ